MGPPGENDDAAPSATEAASARITEEASPGINDIEEVTYVAEFEAFVEKNKLQAPLDVVLEST